MNILNTAMLLAILFLKLFAFASNPDTSSILQRARIFAFNTTEYIPERNFYTEWKNDENPYLYLYISHPNKIKQPVDFTTPFLAYGSDQLRLEKEEQEIKAKGYATFCYKTYATSSAFINKKLLSYPDEAIVFIVFHELIHNYLSSKKILLPYEFNEALCDVIGNYGTLEYSRTTGQIDTLKAIQLIITNESIYSCLNETIDKINQDTNNVLTICRESQKTLDAHLQNANAFQQDRFQYPISTAYLLKNEYYAKHYLLIKKVLFKQKSIQGLLKIIHEVPQDPAACEIYLLKYS